MTQPSPLPPRPPGVPPWPGGPCVTDADLEVCCEQRAAVGECDCAEFAAELAAAPTIVGRWW